MKYFANGVINPADGKVADSGFQKCLSIQQVMIVTTRPRSLLSPLLLGIVVSIRRMYGSRDLVDMLRNMQFSANNKKVQHYEYSLVWNGLPSEEPGGFLELIFTRQFSVSLCLMNTTLFREWRALNLQLPLMLLIPAYRCLES